MRSKLLTALILGCLVCPAVRAAADGAALYAQKCAACHDHPEGRIPTREFIAGLPAQQVVFDLTFGVMQPQGLGLSVEEIAALATYVTGKSAAPGPQPDPDANRCAGTAGRPFYLDESGWNGWGRGVENLRYQPQPGIKPEDVPKLKVKWAFAYPGLLAGAQPTVVGDRLFVTTTTGLIYSLNAKTGCTYWTFQADSEVRAAMSAGPSRRAHGMFALYFADLMKANAYAVDAASGKLLWKTKLDDHPLARITGAPTFYGGRLYVPVSAQEEGYGAVETYACCTFRGSVVALDARTGKIAWKTYTIPEMPKPFKKSTSGVQMYGPAGAAIWSAPTVDAKRRALYVATGDSYTDVDTDAADAIIALDLDTGRRRWVRQVTAHDNFLYGCSVPGKGICPDPVGPDYDFGSSPILATQPNGKQLILAGQKSGILYAMDPDEPGKILWQVQVGPGGMGGGIVWGSATDGETIYVPIANRADSSLSALKTVDGKVLWRKPAPKGVCNWGTQGCAGAETAAVTLIPGVVFSGSTDGHLRAYATADGSILWDFDTGQAFGAVNGVPAVGGSINYTGPAIANGMLYMNSGEGRFNGRRGNALIAFSVDGK